MLRNMLKSRHSLRQLHLAFLLMLITLIWCTPSLWAQRFMRPVRPFMRPVSSNVSFVRALPTTGTFVRSAQGTFNPATGMFSPATSGTSFLRAQGVFTPTKGSFTASPTGNFVLTTREKFNAATGTFVPSATGNFVLSTRGTLTSSSTGTAVESFLPLLPPRVFNPYVNAAGAPFLNTLANPYLATAPSMSPYPMPMYASGSYGMMPYSNPYTSTSPGPAYGTMGAAPAADVQIMPGLGIPFENGHVQWPLAFRLMGAEQKRDLADRLEGQLLALGTDVANPGLARSAKHTVHQLAGWLTAHQTDMADATYRQGLEFLHGLDESLAGLIY